MSDCLFCKIINGEIPSTKLYEDELVYAFKDIEPQAPVHFLIVPKRHLKSAAEIEAGDGEMLARVYTVAKKVCDELGVENGYRVVTNIGADGGQSVGHLHFHVLAGRQLAWPPG